MAEIFEGRIVLDAEESAAITSGQTLTLSFGADGRVESTITAPPSWPKPLVIEYDLDTLEFSEHPKTRGADRKRFLVYLWKNKISKGGCYLDEVQARDLIEWLAPQVGMTVYRRPVPSYGRVSDV